MLSSLKGKPGKNDPFCVFSKAGQVGLQSDAVALSFGIVGPEDVSRAEVVQEALRGKAAGTLARLSFLPNRSDNKNDLSVMQPCNDRAGRLGQAG